MSHMAAFLYIATLAFSALSVSALGAAFSVFGLMRLFAGAPVAVAMMASALEFSKLVSAAFLHRTWDRLNVFYRTYLLIAVVVLSGITSMGIFGFLSDAYQSSSKDLTADNIRIEALKSEQVRNTDEIARINRGIEEIPMDRISKKLRARKEAEPLIQDLTRKTDQIAKELEEINLRTVDLKAKIGPLIYVSRVFNQDSDTIVKWLILVFVGVFDPLAICLVIATSEALKLKNEGHLGGKGGGKSVRTHVVAVKAEEVREESLAFNDPVTASVDPLTVPVQTEGSVRMRFVGDTEPKKAG
jgi:hypothetical protein